MSDILNLLQSPSRYELSGDRLTSYGLEVGAGSLNYWNGGWDNNEYMTPEQLENIFANRDGSLELFYGKDESITPRVYEHKWFPDHTETRFLLPHNARLEQYRWIDRDVATVALTIRHASPVSLPMTFAWRGELLPGERARQRATYTLLQRDHGRLAGVRRLFALNAEGIRGARVQANRAQTRITLEAPQEGGVLYLFWSLGLDEKEAAERLAAVRRDPRASMARARARWRRFFTHNVPRLEGTPTWLTRQYYHLFYAHEFNRYSPLGGPLKHSFTCPSKLRLLPQWFWDSAFQSIVENWLNDFSPTQGSLLNIIDAQKEDGQLPFALDREGFTFDRIHNFATIQPFALPMAVWDIYLKRGEVSWLQRTLPALVRFDRWLERNRQTPDGLIAIRASSENGWDNTVRFLSKPGDPRGAGSQESGGIRPADFNALILIARQLIGRMAGCLGEDRLAREYAGRCRDLSSAIGKLWTPRRSQFADRLADNSLSTVRTPGGFVPLLAGIATREQVQAIVKAMTDPRHFWSRYPLTTLSMADPRFNDRDEYASYINGRTWPHVNWLIVEGLMRHGQRDVARRLVERSLAMVSASGQPVCAESFHPRQAHIYEIGHNALCYGWGAMPNDMLLRRVLGIQPFAPGQLLCLDPLWLDGLQEVQLSNLQIGTARVGLHYRLIRKKLQVDVAVEGGQRLSVRTGPTVRSVTRNGRARVASSAQRKRWHWVGGMPK